MHKQSKGYKTISKTLNVPRDTFGNTVHKFKVKGTVDTLPGLWQVVKKPGVTAKDLHQDEVSVYKMRHILTVSKTHTNTEEFHIQTPRHPPLWMQKCKKSCLI